MRIHFYITFGVKPYNVLTVVVHILKATCISRVFQKNKYPPASDWPKVEQCLDHRWVLWRAGTSAGISLVFVMVLALMIVPALLTVA